MSRISLGLFSALLMVSLAISPAQAISPIDDFNSPADVQSSLRERPKAEPAEASQHENTRPQDADAIKEALQANEASRGDSLREALREESLADRAEGGHDLELAQEAKTVDLHLGKVLTDLHGQRVRMEEYVLRPAANQIRFLNLTLRNQRLDYINYLATFNTTLPQSTRGVWQKDFGLTPPPVYLTQETATYSNLADCVASAVTYFSPTWDILASRFYLPERQQTVRVNQILKWGMERPTPYTLMTAMPGAVGLAGVTGQLINNNVFATRILWTWKDGTQTELQTTLIDENGNVRSLDPKSLSDWAYWSQHLGDLVFNSFTERIWTATEFQGRDIDTVSQLQTLVRFLSKD